MEKEQIHLIQNLIYNSEKFKILPNNLKEQVNNFLLSEINNTSIRYKDLLKNNSQSINIYKIIIQNTFKYINNINQTIDVNGFKNQKKNELDKLYANKQLEFSKLNNPEKPKEINFNIETDNSNENISNLLEMQINERNKTLENYYNETDKKKATEWINNNTNINTNTNSNNSLNNSLNNNYEISNSKILKIDQSDKKVKFDEIVETISYNVPNEDNEKTNIFDLFKNFKSDNNSNNSNNSNNTEIVNMNKINITDINNKIDNIENKINIILNNQKEILSLLNK